MWIRLVHVPSIKQNLPLRPAGAMNDNLTFPIRQNSLKRAVGPADIIASGAVS